MLITVSQKDKRNLEPIKNVVRISCKFSPSLSLFPQPENGIFSSFMVYADVRFNAKVAILEFSLGA